MVLKDFPNLSMSESWKTREKVYGGILSYDEKGGGENLS